MLSDGHPLVITYRWAKRIAVALVGFTVLAVGVAMIVLPGPAFLVIPIGLGILSIEFAWARRWLRKVKERSAALVDAVKRDRSVAGATAPPQGAAGAKRNERL
ncbi:MAG TPA: PGPGW domain-containing protein [Steroidobacteraceae bacterium]|jgi:uncharacterized protein (TIGR02611 family)|nr:PGPGW domain-containing protein [Steroidobacteraceae bacterium]